MKAKFRYFILISFTIFLSGCLGSRYLKDNEQLLYRQKIEGNKLIASDELQNLLRQKPNRRIPLIPFSPYVYVYHYGEKHYDRNKLNAKKDELIRKYDEKIRKEEDLNNENSKRVTQIQRQKTRKIGKIDKTLDEGNLWMRWGEPLAVFDTAAAEKAASQMQLFYNSKGFFNSGADYSVKTSKKYATVSYNIKEGKPHTFDSIFFNINDSSILSLVKKNNHLSLIEKSKNFDADKLAEERDRLENLLKNHGYYDFKKNFIEFNIDTTLNNNGVAVEVVIHDPLKRSNHKIFQIDSVIVTTDASAPQLRGRKRIGYHNGVTFLSYNDKYSKKILDRRLFIHPGDLYSKENTIETQKQLANLDMFKFINIYYDTTGNKTIANINTSPLKKYQTSNEFGLTVIQGGLPGPFIFSTLKNRNIFGGMEIFELSGRAGIEGVAAATDRQEILRSREYGVNASLLFPQFLFPLNDHLRYSLGRMNPRTRWLAGFTYTDRPEYVRQIIKSSLTYTWQKEQKILYSFTLADVNLIKSEIRNELFRQSLEEFGTQIIRSFEPSFVSSSIFSTTFNFNRYGSFKGNEASFLRLYAESGGTTLNFFGNEVLEPLNLQSFQFLKFNVDYRKYLPNTSGSTFAYRVNVGIARPYGENKALPYEKYFFAGGSNSIRAWRPRRLGPGSYTPEPRKSGTRAIREFDPAKEGPFDYWMEQPGDIILETSFEWRRNLIGFIDGALFLDAGNVWTFNEVENRPGGQFQFSDFYKEIAVGTGIGLRLDFSFLLVRLDVGTKVMDPAREEGHRFVLGKTGFRRPYGINKEPLVYNIGIGYPF